jgi:hypothetical protein
MCPSPDSVGVPIGEGRGDPQIGSSAIAARRAGRPEPFAACLARSCRRAFFSPCTLALRLLPPPPVVLWRFGMTVTAAPPNHACPTAWSTSADHGRTINGRVLVNYE